MNKTLSFLAIPMISSVFSLAQAQSKLTIDGILINEKSEPISGATIRLTSLGLTTSTDSQGRFVFDKLSPDDYKVDINAFGYSKKQVQVNLRQEDQHLGQIRLDDQSESIDEVSVYGKYYQNYKFDSISGSLRLKTPILELPQNIQVISSDLMADQQVFDIVDGITRNISGATRQGHWDNQYANIRMRGSKIPAFRNGMNIEASWGPTAEDASMIERIEFVKGPAGFMLASGEPGGFYNVVTKKPTGHTKGSATFNTGSFDLYRGAVDLDGRITKSNKLLYRLNVAAQKKGFFTKYNNSKRLVVAPVITYNIDSLTAITAEYTFQGSSYLNNGNYTFSPKGFADPNIANDFFYGDPGMEPGKLRDHSAYIYLDRKLSQKWKFHAQAAYFNFDMKATSTWLNYMTAEGDMPRYYNTADEHGENKFGQFSFNGEERTGNIRHRILAGVDYGNKKFWGDFSSLLPSIPGEPLNVYNPVYGIPESVFPKVDRTLDIKERAKSQNYITTSSYTSFYVHDEMAFLEDRLKLSLGLRFTSSSVVSKTGADPAKDKIWSPRAGINYMITPSASVYALFDQSFVPVSGTDWEGNAFRPIRGNNMEAGVKKEWGGGKWISTLSAYQIKRKNALVEDSAHPNPNGGFFSMQIGETTSKGIEFDITGEIVRGLNVNANYALTDSKISKDTKEENIGNITPNTAKHTANAWVSYRLQQGALRGLGLMGSVQGMFDRAIGTTKESNFKNYLRTDGGISYQKGKYNISVMVNNLLDNRKLLTAGSFTRANAAAIKAGGVDYYSYIVEARRNFRLGVTYKF
ncbi:TonB-dependent siderophore receptor [Sphingobacterium sp. N143]|uniref:TonB-dependent siderophore receptor n=1 Tax=Sphingobacterium sp. N143 TaxID=2746727 RepID=UPI0025754BA1|nr:TonB-dependent siderophore receptor [Sphingobacterium sp. N143]MDM1293813.1 TonB-dependent siderophore receptor [Sphingobacterium sp. N143]